MNRNLTNRVTRLERTNPPLHLQANFAHDAVRDFASYELYCEFCARYLKVVGRDPWTDDLRIEWRDADAMVQGTEAALPYRAIHGSGGDFQLLEEEELARLQHLMRLELPMPERDHREFQALWRKGYPHLQAA